MAFFNDFSKVIPPFAMVMTNKYNKNNLWSLISKKNVYDRSR